MTGKIKVELVQNSTIGTAPTRRLASLTRVLSAVVAAASLVVASAGLAAATDEFTQPTATASPAAEVVYDAAPRVPVVESQAGVADALSTDPGARIALKGISSGHDTALVRISVLDTPGEVTVFSEGAPALSTHGGSASTAVLVPVVDGSISLYGTAATPLRVEVLASFIGDPAVPGSTIALPTPVKRADTSEGLADEVLNSAEATVGVVGLGGVPAAGVRSVYLSATVSVPSATMLSIGAQSVAIRAGKTVVTTVVSPDVEGNVPVRIASGSGSLRVDVRGWVPDAPQNSPSVNGPGSFVPTTGFAPQTIDVSAGKGAQVTTGAPKDGALSLMLVSTTAPGASTGLTTIDLGTVGSVTSARNQGALVDPTRGAQPQLVLAPSTGAKASIVRGASQLTVFPVGSVLASTPTGAAQPTIAITSPTDGSQIDLADFGTFTLEGTLQSPGASIRSVTVKAGDTIAGTALVQYTPDGLRWSFQTSVPRSGTYTFTVEAVDRSGAKASQATKLAVALPNSEEIVVAENANVLPESVGGVETVMEVTDNSIQVAVEPAITPGTVIVGDASANAPEGYLRKVEAIDKTDAGWTLTTSPALLTDVFVQADFEGAVDLVEEGDPAVEQFVGPQPGDTQDVEILDEGEPAVQVLPIEDVDVAPLPDVFTADGPSSRSLSPRADVSADLSAEISSGISISSDLTWSAEGALKDESKASKVKKAATKMAVRGDAGVTLGTEIGLSVSLELVLRVSANWGWNTIEPSIDEFSVIAGLTEKVSSQAEATFGVGADASWERSMKKTVAKLDFSPVTFMVGPVPVIITSTANAGVEAKIDAKIGAEGRITVGVETSVQRTTKKGFTFSTAAGMKQVDTTNTTYKPPTMYRSANLSVKGSFTAKGGLFTSIDLSIYDAAGPKMKITAGPGANLDVKASSDGSTSSGSVDAAVFLEAKAEASVELKLPVVDKTVLEWKFTPLEAKLELWKMTLAYDTAFPVKDLPGANPGGGTNPPQSGWAEVSAGGEQSYLVDGDGNVFGCGYNLYGQLGLGDQQDRYSIARVPGLSNVVAVTTSYSHSLALTRDGSVFAWGSNDRGQLGLGDQQDRYSPVQIPGLSDVTAISAKGPYSLALTRDGSVLAWGSNWHGALGLGDTENRYVPVQVPGLSNVTDISAGGEHALALTRSGSVFAWGSNWNGALGLGDMQNRYSPVQVPGLSNVMDVSAERWKSLALTRDGSVFAWGYNDRGQLGVGDEVSRFSPVQIGLSDVEAVFTGYTHSLALTRDGSVFAWGHNVHGQLGLGDQQDRYSPVQVPGLSNVVGISAHSHTLALTRDGSVFAWGYNDRGQLGLGDTESRLQPTLVSRG